MPGHTHSEKENSDSHEKFKIKRFASGCDEMQDSRSIEGKDKLIIDRSSEGNFGEFGPLLWDLWSFELGRSALESLAFPFLWLTAS